MQPATTIDIKTTEAAVAAITQVIESMAEIILASGISIADACQMLRVCAVRVAARDLRSHTGKESKSRVAIVTGLSRSEVSRLWSKARNKQINKFKRQSRSQRVIDAWFDSPAYLTKDGDPDSIPIFGRRKSLEHLVKIHGGGIPVRAMLDELLSIGAVEADEKQRLRIKSRVAIQRGIRAASLQSLGTRASDLLSTLAHNLTSEPPHFEATAYVCDVDPKSLPLVRREVGNRGSTFVSSIDEFLNAITAGSKLTARKSIQSGRRAGVGVFYFEEKPSIDISHLSIETSRRYLKRARKPNRAKK